MKIIPPNTGSNVQKKKDGYTWEDLDKAWWEGFDNAKNKMEKQIAELEKKNRELGDRLCNVANNLLDSWCRNEEDYCPHLAKLEAQIEKMKCCSNCRHSRTEYEHCRTDKHEKWEIKENAR